MDETVFTTIALTGFTIAFFHAAIPTHWLPFVITARAQRWNRNKTIAVTALAGTGHVLFTALLGLLIAWFGIALHERIGDWFPWIAGGALLLFGLLYLYRQFSGSGCGHSHLFGGHALHGSLPHLHPRDQTNRPPGPHGGTLIDIGSGLIEMAIDHSDNTSVFRLFPADAQHDPLEEISESHLSLETVRSNEKRETFSFRKVDRHFVSIERIPEPHQFRAILSVVHGDHTHAHETYFQSHGMPPREGIEVVAHPAGRVSDRTAIASLLALLTFSPCESFLPVYVSGVRYGWIGFALLTAILSIATVLAMVVFTWLTVTNLERLNLRFLEKYESGIIGALLCTLGILIIAFER